MLSFQKDEQNTVVENIQADQEPQQQAGITKQEDYLTVASHGKKLRQSTMTLAILFAVGALGVWFMIKKTVPASANAAPNQDQVQLEAALAQINSVQSEVTTQMDSVVGRFNQFGNVDQIAVEELKKNPFKREFGDVQEDIDTNKLADNELKFLQDKAYRQVQQLELWSITSTPKGKCCMVNTKLLYEGDSIDEMVVKTINKKSVIFEYNGVPVELKMSE